MRIHGTVTWELRDRRGRLEARGQTRNLVTDVGDQLYAERGAGISGAPALPTGMKLGTGGAAVAKSGAGAALGSYLTDSDQAFDALYPTSGVSAGKRRITYRAVWAAGKATTAGAITEVVIVNEALADATSLAAATVARALITGVASKAADKSLTVIWTHDLLGA